mmetsp:Transcript_27742/g.65871  ORF Transcript_27742/g.65871 Transcript_27742/m.65871 type:complete len:252 (-) Transcript_27742:3064-3819(-)
MPLRSLGDPRRAGLPAGKVGGAHRHLQHHLVVDPIREFPAPGGHPPHSRRRVLGPVPLGRFGHRPGGDHLPEGRDARGLPSQGEARLGGLQSGQGCSAFCAQLLPYGRAPDAHHRALLAQHRFRPRLAAGGLVWCLGWEDGGERARGDPLRLLHGDEGQKLHHGGLQAGCHPGGKLGNLPGGDGARGRQASGALRSRSRLQGLHGGHRHGAGLAGSALQRLSGRDPRRHGQPWVPGPAALGSGAYGPVDAR